MKKKKKKKKLNETNNIVEIEFVIVVNKENQTINMEKSYYNLIYSEDEWLEITFNVRFNESFDKSPNNKSEPDKGHLQSGRIGYSIGQPLIVYTDDNYTKYKEYGYVIYGKGSDGICYSNDKIFNLEYDKPILFGENFIYSCSIEVKESDDFEAIKEKIQSTLPYIKMSNLRINYLGSPSYQMNPKDLKDLYKDDEDIDNLSKLLDKKFTEFNKNKENENKNPNVIKLNIYVDSIGPSNGPIYQINYIEPTIEGVDKKMNFTKFYINFEINFIFPKASKNYKTSGSVLPKMPTDIIQPFVELDI